MKHSQLAAQLYTISDVPPLNSSHRGSKSDREIAIICGEAGAKMRFTLKGAKNEDAQTWKQ